jgi:hypothetical protein
VKIKMPQEPTVPFGAVEWAGHEGNIRVVTFQLAATKTMLASTSIVSTTKSRDRSGIVFPLSQEDCRPYQVPI